MTPLFISFQTGMYASEFRKENSDRKDLLVPSLEDNIGVIR
jgi:hypothetical protein